MPTDSIPIAEALRVARIKAGSVRMWRKRARDRAKAGGSDQATLRSEFFEPPGGRVDRDGLRFLVTFGELSSLGLTLHEATEIALLYTEADQQIPPRPAGRPFDTGRTALAVSRSPVTGALDARVTHLAGDGQPQRPDDLFLMALAQFAPPATAVMLVDLNAVEARVSAALAADDDQGAVA